MFTNTVLIDYITMTSFVATYEHLARFIIKHFEVPNEDIHPKKVMQYEGFQVNTKVGTIFVGNTNSGVGGLTSYDRTTPPTNHIVRVSGDLCNHFPLISALIGRMDRDNLTRIDLQVTVPEPIEYDPTATFNLIRQAKPLKTLGLCESTGRTGKLTTVYIGSRKSNSFARLYQKDYSKGRYLRLEFEIKKDKAKVLKGKLHEGGKDCLAAVYAGLASAVIDPFLVDLFTPLVDREDTLTVGRRDTDTYAWVMDTCIPTIAKYVSTDKQGGHDIIERLKKLVADYG